MFQPSLSSLQSIIIDEYEKLDDKFHISNEYEKTQIISEIYRYLLDVLKKNNYYSIMKKEEKRMRDLKDDFLVVDLKPLFKDINSIDIEKIVCDENEIFKEKRSSDCMYCSSKDICLRIAQN